MLPFGLESVEVIFVGGEGDGGAEAAFVVAYIL
jgi:hypothetical protein